MVPLLACRSQKMQPSLRPSPCLLPESCLGSFSAMAKNLVIVESPAKAKTIKKFLGKDFEVEASMGHIRDLPESELAVDVEGGFTPKYVIPKKKQTVVKALQSSLKKASVLWIATDEDREGEAIGWHLVQALKVKDPERVKRIVFHEITREAILQSIDHPRGIDMKLVEAQQARRILDRLVGYTLSPFLWKKVYRGLSAGRVQSVAVRLIVDREREVEAFRPEEYWSITASLENRQSEEFTAELKEQGGKKCVPARGEEARAIVEQLTGASFVVDAIEEKEVRRSPPPPFTTSTLQQDAARKLGFSVKQTMVVAQQLYEGISLGDAHGQTGLITYMRTDSVHLSEKALHDAQAVIGEIYGREYILSSPRRFKTKSKGAQEAHEAIRPTELHRTPDSLAGALDEQQLKLYRLIWERTIASQMPAAELQRRGVNIGATPPSAAGTPYTFRATGQTIAFDGFLRVYREGREEEANSDQEASDGEKILPPLVQGEGLRCLSLAPEQHFTKPPPRYTEASFVKKLEEEGIGRPSTYAPTISTIQQRGYIRREGRQLIPEDVARTVTDLMVAHFPDIVDLAFTARMEESLDEIAVGKREWQPFLQAFFDPFHQLVERKTKEISKEDTIEEKTSEICEKCSKPMKVKLSRYGKFLACSAFPRCRFKKSLPSPTEGGAGTAPPVDLGTCPECTGPLVQKRGRFGAFVGCSNYPRCRFVKKTSSSTGLPCPTCQRGEILVRRTKRGRTFWGCSTYPACTYATWKNPVQPAPVAGEAGG